MFQITRRPASRLVVSTTAPAARVLGGDLREQLWRHLLLDLALERP
jgi:hypothetical protein